MPSSDPQLKMTGPLTNPTRFPAWSSRTHQKFDVPLLAFWREKLHSSQDSRVCCIKHYARQRCTFPIQPGETVALPILQRKDGAVTWEAGRYALHRASRGEAYPTGVPMLKAKYTPIRYAAHLKKKNGAIKFCVCSLHAFIMMTCRK